ncbi:hypothetical protein [Parasitella parasitica]|uniref:26S proteasome non-ATPase regulatory subunit 5 n=1 Tax=Parasitella parasitica TaxID=35722 RepID=A0A0B7NJL7_9FUNG|nr:hypothetical protein [Parasitella parasitica]
MSPAPSNLLEQVSLVLQPNASVSNSEKIAVLQAFAATMTASLSFERATEILQAVPLGLFYYGFSVEDDQLTTIATTSAGLSFLEKANLLGTITTVLDNPDDFDVVVQLVKCAVLKFMGNLGENEQIPFEAMSNKYKIMEKIEKCLETQNIEILIVAISTIGLVGSHPTGLKLLSDSLLTTFFSRYETAVGQVKAVYLQSISKMISVRDGTEQVEISTMNIYERIQGRPSTLLSLIKEAKQPEDSVRVASFAVMQAIAYHAWGVQLMAQSNEFMNYILNRSTEYTEQGQSWKYAIIQTLASAPDASRVLNEHYAQLQVYVRQGAHFKILEPAAAVENS